MTRAGFRVRKDADADFDAALDYYLTEADEGVALRFVDAVEDAYRLIAGNPAIGSTRLPSALGLDRTRTWPVSGFPYIIVYVEGDPAPEIWRLLQGQRDLPALLTGQLE